MSDGTNQIKQKSWFARHKIWTGIIAFFAVCTVIAATGGGSKNASSTNPATPTPLATAKTTTPTVKPTATPTPKPSTPKPTPKVATRQVTGTATTLGAGTFAGGKDVVAGLYDVTTSSGESGNFMVDGTDSYNEILGVAEDQGVPKIRVQISNGDTITISSLSRVVFTPVATPFITSHVTTSIYTGTFIVGQDVGPGRYIATPGSGQSGNFIVDGTDSYNEILGGDSSLGGVPSLTVNLSKGDIITVSSLSQVTLTTTN